MRGAQKRGSYPFISTKKRGWKGRQGLQIKQKEAKQHIELIMINRWRLAILPLPPPLSSFERGKY